MRLGKVNTKEGLGHFKWKWPMAPNSKWAQGTFISAMLSLVLFEYSTLSSTITSRLSDKERENPPKIGAIITYRFQELTPDGVPRFPSYVGERVDMNEPKDPDVPNLKKKKNSDE